MIAGGQVTLFVSDVGASVRFYVETLGMKLVEEGGAGYAVIDAGEGFRLALHAGGANTKGVKGVPTVGLFPKMAIKDAIAILENRGVSLATSEDATMIVATFHDPDGNVLYLRQGKQDT